MSALYACCPPWQVWSGFMLLLEFRNRAIIYHILKGEFFNIFIYYYFIFLVSVLHTSYIYFSKHAFIGKLSLK